MAPAARPAVAVAFSGGRDSTALLHATAASAAPLGIAVVALHVHHGLSAHADAWLAHSEALCRRWSRRGPTIEFRVTRLTTAPTPGESVEAWARRARYAALAAMACEAGIDLVLLGHHRRDQAETFLLQALRGGGVKGLAAMPRIARRADITWARPWLAVPADDVAAYARRHRLRWIEDDSNTDTRLARNRLRLEVWPALAAAFTDAETTLAAAATRAQEAAAAVAEVAEADLAAVADASGLSIAAWSALPVAHRRPALSAWLRVASGRAVPVSLVERLAAELDAGRPRQWPGPGGTVSSYRGRLRWRADAVEASDEQADTSTAEASSTAIVDLRRPGLHAFHAWRGTLRVEPVEQGGIAAARLARATLRGRLAGDRFQAGTNRPPRGLKLQFQAAAVPAWERVAPIVCIDGQPVFVAGLGIDARAWAAPGEPQLGLAWLPDAAHDARDPARGDAKAAG